MYLNLLNEEEKGFFLASAYYLATVDGDYSIEEQAVMQGYCQEMQMQFDLDTMVKPIEEIILKIKNNCNIKVKKIFIFELIGLSMSDGKYDENERMLIDHMENEFDIEADFGKKCESILGEYISFQNRINKIILE